MFAGASDAAMDVKHAAARLGESRRDVIAAAAATWTDIRGVAASSAARVVSASEVAARAHRGLNGAANGDDSTRSRRSSGPRLSEITVLDARRALALETQASLGTLVSPVEPSAGRSSPSPVRGASYARYRADVGLHAGFTATAWQCKTSPSPMGPVPVHKRR